MTICIPITRDLGTDSPLSPHFGSAAFFMIVGGIGAGAIAKLDAAGIRVFLYGQATVGETIDAFRAGTLKPATPEMACAHQNHR